MRPDFYSMHARKLLGLPESWCWFRLNGVELSPGRTAVEVTGAIPSVAFKSGKRKGELNWKKAVSKATVTIIDSDHLAFIRAWEESTGLCSNCGGSGKELARWHHIEGETMRPCSKCKRAEAKP